MVVVFMLVTTELTEQEAALVEPWLAVESSYGQASQLNDPEFWE